MISKEKPVRISTAKSLCNRISHRLKTELKYERNSAGDRATAGFLLLFPLQHLMQAVGVVGEHAGDAPGDQLAHVFLFVDCVGVNLQVVGAHLLHVLPIDLIEVGADADGVGFDVVQFCIIDLGRRLIGEELDQRDIGVHVVDF